MIKSWAVSKLPSIDHKVKRLAMMVEGHPLITAILKRGRNSVVDQGHW